MCVRVCVCACVYRCGHPVQVHITAGMRLHVHVHVHVCNQHHIPSKREVEILIEYFAVLPFRYCLSILLFTFLFIGVVHLLNRQIQIQELSMWVVFPRIVRFVPRNRVGMRLDTIYSFPISLVCRLIICLPL